ncbi:MAG: sensor histidine kinase [Janthinobacterium lividum]
MAFSHFWRLRALRHGIVWVLVMGLLVAATHLLPDRETPKNLPQLLLPLLLLAGPIYVHYWLLSHLLERGRYARYTIALLATVVLGALLLDAIEHFVLLIVATDKEPAYRFNDFIGSVFAISLALLTSTMARYVRRGIISRNQMQQLRALQLETELSLLKAQVNQHFLFNTLNNLYGLSLAAPEQMPEALLQLAGLMRYQLDSSRQATVTVGTEAEYLANYIGLEKLRLRANTQVEYVADLPHPDRPLAPLLLLPLVENCFKHAIGPGSSNTIRIRLTQTDAGLTLRTDNSIPPHFRPAPSGLGLPTLRARLAQFYPGNGHRFHIEATATQYTATLLLAL